MIQGLELFLSLFNNLALFIALVCLYGVFISRFGTGSRLNRQVVLGLVFGLFALGCMNARIPVYEGVVVDQRNAILVLSGAFGGPVSALLTGTMAAGYRVYLGGGGVLGGVMGICLAGAAGMGLHRIGRPFSSSGRAVSAALSATLLILPGFLVMPDLQTGWALMKAMALPYGSACFSGILLAGLLLNRREEEYRRELAFQVNQERLDLALSGANEGLWDWNLETDEVHFDSRYYALSGYDPGEFPGTFEEWEKRIHPEDLPRVRSGVRQYLAGELAQYNIEFRFRHKSGEYMWILGKGKIVARNPAGKPLRFVGIHSDITEKKEIERSLKITRFSFDTAAIGIYLVGSDARILDVNPHAARLLGHTPKELTRRTIFDIDPAINQEEWARIWDTLCQRKADQFERTHLHRDGSLIPVEVTSSLFVYENQPFSLSFVKDIRPRKAAEDQLRGLRNYLASIIESMPSILICLDARGCATHWNKRAEQFMAASAADPGSDPADKLFPFLGPFMPAVKKSLDTRKVRQILRHPFEWGSGLVGTSDITIYPLSAHGLDGSVVRIDDVTEKVKMEDALVQNEKMLSLGGLAAGMAHEIKNPLSGMIQTAGVLSNRLTCTDLEANQEAADALGLPMEAIAGYMERRKVPDLLGAVMDTGTRMAAIVDNMLNFSRKSDASFVPRDPGKLVDDVLTLAAAGYDRNSCFDFRSIEIEKAYAGDLPLVACEGGEIQQVILNILNNGAQAMFETPGQKPPKFIIRLAYEKAAEMVCLEIQDNGPGMEAAVQNRIFEPFFTTKPAGAGTGLGLFVSYFIVTENHQGTMAVKSRPGEGSNFILRIPVQHRLSHA